MSPILPTRTSPIGRCLKSHSTLCTGPTSPLFQSTFSPTNPELALKATFMNPETVASTRQQVLETLKTFRSRAIHVGELRARLHLERDKHTTLFGILETMAEEGVLTQLPGGRFRLRKRAPVSQPTPDPKGTHGEQPPRTRRARPADATNGRMAARPDHPNRPDRPDRGNRPPRDEHRPRNARDSQREENLRNGILVLNPRGFGFVTTEEEGPDVFIPAMRVYNAMHGDTVQVAARPSAKGLEGRVVRVTKRGTEYIGGQLVIAPSHAYIESDDERLRYPIQINNALPKNLESGQSVIARITHYPGHPQDRLEAEVVESFEPKQLVEFETKRILFREGAVETFEEQALAAAQALPRAVPERDKRGRTDLRPLDLVTIDPADAKDHDDAVWAERTDDGGFRVIIAIADVSHYVPEGSALDLEAQARSCTIYLPSKAIPMLPSEISSNLASLVPNRDRLALAVEVFLGPRGAIKKYKLHEAVVRSHGRLTYAGVAKALGLTTDGPTQRGATSRLPLLQTMMDVAEQLGKKRKLRGSLEFDLPEPKVKLEETTGRPLDIVRSRSDAGVRKAYNMIEEFALLANEVVAAELTKRKLPTIYRVHGAPDAEKVGAFCELATSLGFDIDATDAQNPKKLNRLLGKLRKTDKAETVGYLLLRAMQQAAYDVDNIGHFGLAAKEYVHFTSPIRRYPDLATHRVVRQLARGENVRTQGLREKLISYCESASRLERRAMLIEREVVDLFRAMIMQDRVGEIFDAKVTGIAEHGVFASIDAPFVDVLCRLATFPRDDWETDTFGIRLTGAKSGKSFELGQSMQVKIEDVSLSRRKVSALPLEFVEDEQDAEVSEHRAREARTSRRPSPRSAATPPVAPAASTSRSIKNAAEAASPDRAAPSTPGRPNPRKRKPAHPSGAGRSQHQSKEVKRSDKKRKRSGAARKPNKVRPAK